MTVLTTENPRETRKTEHDIHEIFIDRWSPRAMSGEPIADKELFALFEAAKWAPSSYNNQPWRFIYAKNWTKHWPALFNTLVEFNQQWAQQAAALVLIVSRKTFEKNGKPARTHSFDTGAAWQNLALQGAVNGLVVHGMEGFDYEKAREAAGVPDDYEIEAMAAIGRPGKKENLPEEMREKEKPSDRKKLAEIVFEGAFSARKNEE